MYISSRSMSATARRSSGRNNSQGWRYILKQMHASRRKRIHSGGSFVCSGSGQRAAALRSIRQLLCHRKRSLESR